MDWDLTAKARGHQRGAPPPPFAPFSSRPSLPLALPSPTPSSKWGVQEDGRPRKPPSLLLAEAVMEALQAGRRVAGSSGTSCCGNHAGYHGWAESRLAVKREHCLQAVRGQEAGGKRSLETHQERLKTPWQECGK